MFLNTDPEQITAQELQSLIASQTAELRQIEYKRDLPGKSERDVKEFLYDVSSFANAAGGHLIYGMEAVDGVPTQLRGLAVSSESADQAKLRLEAYIRSHIRPRIPGLGLHAVGLSSDRYALVIYVPKSWIPPHGVAYQGQGWRFYSRNSAGKYMLDIEEIRQIFRFSETTSERIRQFRVDRISKILGNDLPVPLIGDSMIILHVLPVGALEYQTAVNLQAIRDSTIPLETIAGYGDQRRLNFDGLLSYQRVAEGPGKTDSYVLLFRNGIIEAGDCQRLDWVKQNVPQNKPIVISGAVLESVILNTLRGYMRVYHEQGVEPPFVLMISFLGVKNFTLHHNRQPLSWGREQPAIDRDHLIMPEVLIEDKAADLPTALRSTFDLLWNAAGWDQSRSYDANGRWQAPK